MLRMLVRQRKRGRVRDPWGKVYVLGFYRRLEELAYFSLYFFKHIKGSGLDEVQISYLQRSLSFDFF